jgi:predicted permease
MRELLIRLRHMFQRRRFDDELAEEMAFHRAMKQRELQAGGRTPEEATVAARRAFGSEALALDRARDVWAWWWLQDVARDLRYAWRTLRKNPGFAAVAVLTLALGIGANTAIFSLLNAVLLRTLPVREPQQLVFFGRALAAGSTGFIPSGRTELLSYPFFRDFRRENQAYTDVAAIGSLLYDTHGRVASGSDLEKIKVELVSGNYFGTLGVNAIAGRTLSDADDVTAGGHPVAVASYSWWQRRLAGSPSAIGATISIASRTYVVIGVAPRGFSGMTVGQAPDLWIPLAMQQEISPGWHGRDQPMFRTLHLIGRLKPGVTRGQAQTATNLLFRQILRTYVGSQPSERTLSNIERAYIDLTAATAGRSNLRAQFSSPLKILMAVVGVVLLIACANVANLLLARASTRQREIAVRMSLGAGRLRVVRQLLAESVLLGVAGAALGMVFASSASRLLLALVSTGTEAVPLVISPDLRVLAFTLAATVITVLLFGMAPAFHATRLNLVPSLKEGGHVISASGRTRFSRVIAVGQVALSLALIAGAVLFLHSLSNLMRIDTGFNKRDVLVAFIDPSAAGYKVDARLNAMMEDAEAQIARVPGVRAVSFALDVFDGGGWSTDDIAIPGRQRSPTDVAVDLNVVGAQYFDVMKMPIIAGRALDARDARTAPKVAVVNQTMARMFFGEPSPLGRTFTVRDDEKTDAAEWENIIVAGVVKDARYMELEEKQMPAAFFPHAQHQRQFLFTIVMRHDGDAASVLPSIRRAVSTVDPNLPLGDVTTLSRLVDDSVVNKRAIAQLSAFFAALATLLACVGIYGVTSYGITRRTNEFGIRLALGARRSQVLWLVLSETMWLGSAGVVVGLIMALAAGRLVSSVLFGLTPYDPLAIGVAGVTMIAVSVLAGIMPAWRATRIDPLAALRRE